MLAVPRLITPAAAVPALLKLLAGVPKLASPALVGLVMWTEMVWPGARLSPAAMKEEDSARLWLPSAPVIVKSVGLPSVESIVQMMSPRAGRQGVVQGEAVAAPVPLLSIVTVKPAVPPALTVGVLVVLLMSTSGAVMLIVAVDSGSARRRSRCRP